MTVRCTFSLNNKDRSELYFSGYGTVSAFSGHDGGRDNPEAVSVPNVGPLPPGMYYLVDRQSGGHLGWLYDLLRQFGYGTTDHTKWFTLWNAKSGDMTFIEGVKRGHFRLHPTGDFRLGEGCITVVSPMEFERLSRHIRASPPTLNVPGAQFKAYGTVEVR